MEKRNILLRLQKRFQDGGYALVSPKTGKISTYAEDLEMLYKNIERKKISDSDKVVMYIPPPKVKHVFFISLSIRVLR